MADLLKQKQIPKRPIVHSIQFFRDTMAMYPKYIHSLTMSHNSKKTKALKLIKRAKFIKKFLDKSSLKETTSLHKHSQYLTFLQPSKYNYKTLSHFPKVEHLLFNVQLLQHWKIICSRRNIVSLTIENTPSDQKKSQPIDKTFFSRKLEHFDHMLKRDGTLKTVSIKGGLAAPVSDLLNTLAKSLPCLSSNLKILLKSGSEWQEKDSKGEPLSKDLLCIVDSIIIKKQGTLMNLLKGSPSMFQSLKSLNIAFKDIKKIPLYVESFAQLKCLENLKCKIKSLDFDDTVDFLKKFTLPKSIKNINLYIADMDWGEEAWQPSWKTKVEDSDKEVIEVNSQVVQKFLSRWDNLDNLDFVDLQMNFATAPKGMSREIAYKIMRKISPKKFEFKADTDDDVRTDARKPGFDKKCLDFGMVLRDAPNFFKRLQELTLEVEGVNLLNVPVNLKLDCPNLVKIDLKLIVVGIEKLKNMSNLIKAISNNKRPPGTEPDDDDDFDFEACEVYLPSIEVLRDVFEGLKTLKGCKGMLTFDAEKLAEQSFTEEFLKFAQELDGKLEYNMHFFLSSISSSNMKKIGEVMKNDRDQKFMMIDLESKSGSRFSYYRGGGYHIEDDEQTDI